VKRRGGRIKRARRWPKVTIVCDHHTHLIAGVAIGLGPCNDSPFLPEAVKQAVAHVAIDSLMADGAYDAESNHQICRKQLGIRRTFIPINERGFKNYKAPTHYRAQMQRRFPRKRFGQRWQVESVFSRLKRRLRSALTARTEHTREGECLLRILTHNLMIL